LPIRGGAGRNHTDDRIQPPVPLRSGKSSAPVASGGRDLAEAGRYQWELL